MSGTDISREDLRLLLPFLANGSLAGDDRAALERALAEDPALSAELETLRISKDRFFGLIEEFPEMAVEIMRELAHRLEVTTGRLREAHAAAGTHPAQ